MTHLYASNLNPDLFSKDIKLVASRDGFGEGLVLAAAANTDVVGLTADLTESTRMNGFAEKYADRFFQIGVAEQNMMGIAAGLALSGKIPFISSYATFSPGRNWDQLRVSVCYSQANVKIAGCHAGLSVGPDGATHQALEDIAITRVLPNLTVLYPCDAIEARKATLAAAGHSGPVYIRLAREKTPVMTSETSPFHIGKATVVRDGADVAIIASGPLLYEALLAAETLTQEKIQATVINLPSIKPLDEETLRRIGSHCRAIVTVEEHQIHGGIFGAISEFYSSHLPLPVVPVAVMDRFGESGQSDELLKKFGLKAKDIRSAVHRALKMKEGSKR
jgi:transketolase